MNTRTINITGHDVQIIDENAVVECAVASGEHGSACVFLNAENIDISVHIAEGGSLQLHLLSLVENAQHTLASHLEGPHAVSNIDWIFYARGNDKQRIVARNIFAASQGSGEINLKGVAEENAQVTCDGMIDITSEGTGTDAYLTEDVLMLDSTAKVNAIPGLEIKTNDVKASHSATVSKVTPEDLFYFASRGIAQEDARQMYVLGFLGALTGKIADEDIRNTMTKALEEKFSAV